MSTDPDLVALTTPTDEHIVRLRERLADGAERAGTLDIAYTTIDSPLGRLLLAATEHGLARVAFEREDLDGVLEKLAARISSRILRAPRRLDPAARELDEYFARKRKRFTIEVDFTLSRGFRLTVQHYLHGIDYGHTRSYKQVAADVGNPQAVRAVGTACSTNPLPVVVPCHRVLRSDGGLGGYIGGLDAKAALLELEGAA
jgi:methylated-DNA-[protein]-cysteine S-methyltransferase